MTLTQVCDAAPEHAPQFYQLLRVSDGEFMPTVFGDRFERIVTQLFAQTENIFSYQHTRLCVEGKKVAGMCYFFSGAIRKEQAIRTARLMFRAVGAGMFARLPAMLKSDRLLGKLDPDSFYVSNMSVDPAFQGRGLSRILLADAQQRAEEIHAKELLLDVRTQNTQAINVYSRAGYQFGPVRTFWLHGKPYEYLRMRKPLEDLTAWVSRRHV